MHFGHPGVDPCISQSARLICTPWAGRPSRGSCRTGTESSPPGACPAGVAPRGGYNWCGSMPTFSKPFLGHRSCFLMRCVARALTTVFSSHM